MSYLSRERVGGLAVGAGLLVVAASVTAPLGAFDPVAGPLQAAVPPVLFVTALAVHRCLPTTRTAHAGVAATALGTLLLASLTVARATNRPDRYLALLPVVVLGFVSLAVGAPLLARWLRRVGVLGRATAVLVGAGLPAGVLLAALFDELALYPFGLTLFEAFLAGLTLYGLGWCAVGVRLATRTPQR